MTTSILRQAGSALRVSPGDQHGPGCRRHGRRTQPARETLQTLTGVLGLRLDEKKSRSGDADKFIALLVESRTEAQQKKWATSDLIRDRLKDLGWQSKTAKTAPPGIGHDIS